jgi:YidC/Oxa1 family membrane protein insertase
MLIVLMSGTMFFSQKQMMARNAATMGDNPMAQQQKVLLYVMPVFLAAVSFQFPLGILLYWVTTNLWQIVQQAIVLREGQRIDAAAATKGTDGGGAPSGSARGATSGKGGGNGGSTAGKGGKGGRGGASSGRRGSPGSPGGTDPVDRSDARSGDDADTPHPPDVPDENSSNPRAVPPAAEADDSERTGPRNRLPRRGDR